MKSEKAREYLQQKDVDCEYGNYMGIDDGIKAVELAEAEAEGKAVKAFRDVCNSWDDGRETCWFFGGKCEMECTQAKAFIQKLKGE